MAQLMACANIESKQGYLTIVDSVFGTCSSEIQPNWTKIAPNMNLALLPTPIESG